MHYTSPCCANAAFAVPVPCTPQSAPPVTRSACLHMSQRRLRRAATAALALSLALASPSIASPTASAYPHPSPDESSITVNTGRSPRRRPRVALVVAPDVGAGANRDRFDAPFVNAKRALITYKLGRAAEAEMLMRMGVSIACGAIIGMERRAASAPAGVRTLALVALGASVFTLTALLSLSGDSARMGAAVSTGIGFLGAGAINHDAGARRSQRQLVTAASVWIAAALGVAASSGLKFLALVAALVTVAILRWDTLVRVALTFVRRRLPALRDDAKSRDAS